MLFSIVTQAGALADPGTTTRLLIPTNLITLRQLESLKLTTLYVVCRQGLILMVIQTEIAVQMSVGVGLALFCLLD